MKRPALPDDFADLLRQMRNQRDTRLGPVLLAAIAKGWTYQALADPLGVSRQAVAQQAQRVELMPADMPDIPDLPPPPEPPAPKVRPQIPPETVARLREMHAIAQTVRGGTPVDHPARRTSEQLAALMADLTGQGFTAYRIAKDMGINVNTVRFRLGRHGHRSLPPSQEWSRYRNVQTTNSGNLNPPRDLPLTDEQIAEKYRAGASVWQLAGMCGCGQSTIYGRLNRAGVTMRTPHPSGCGRPRRDVATADVIAMYADGLSIRAISESTGLAFGTVWNRLIKSGVQLRQRGGRR